MVWISIRLAGDPVPALRLPAFFTGMLTILMVYVAGKALYGQSAGIIAAHGSAHDDPCACLLGGLAGAVKMGSRGRS